MASVMNALNIGYSGLNAAQVGINTTGHNISNAEVEGYTRQRVVTSAATPISTGSGQVGNGTEIQDIKRVYDSYVFDRYSSVSADKENSDYKKQQLETLSTYFPEIDGVGVKADLADYYTSWQTFADNPNNDAIKVDLAKKTETLTQHIKQTQNQVIGLQSEINNQLSDDIQQVNDYASQLADLNTQIDTAEAGGGYSANDLRDKRNVLEKSLSKLVGSTVNSGQLSANTQVGTNSNTKTESYTLSINGFNIVDGSTFHPLKLTNETSALGFYDLSYERQDGKLIPLNGEIKGGKVGAIFDLRGGVLDTTSGVPVDGVLQNVVADLDAFAKGLIESTNNLYAASATTTMESNNTIVDLSTRPLVNSDLNIKEGAFDVVIYDIDGKEVSRRSINIDAGTTMSDPAGTNTNSIESQIKANVDDNGDANGTNDVDDLLTEFSYQSATGAGDYRLSLGLSADAQSKGYTFAIADKLTNDTYASGSNFAGALGLGRYLDGSSAQDIQLTQSLQDNPTKINAGFSGTAGDNRVALSMVQNQFENYDYTIGTQKFNTTSNGMFDITATYVGTNTNAAISKNQTVSAQFNATELEYFSTSKVNIDEEMTNLIKYQTSYGAAAKVISTIDQMMQTLLGIKQ